MHLMPRHNPTDIDEAKVISARHSSAQVKIKFRPYLKKKNWGVSML